MATQPEGHRQRPAARSDKQSLSPAPLLGTAQRPVSQFLVLATSLLILLIPLFGGAGATQSRAPTCQPQPARVQKVEVPWTAWQKALPVVLQDQLDFSIADSAQLQGGTTNRQDEHGTAGPEHAHWRHASLPASHVKTSLCFRKSLRATLRATICLN